MLSLISFVENTFIDVDDHLSLSHVLNVVSCSQLPLKFSLLLIVCITDWLHFLVGKTQPILQIAIDHSLAQVKLDFFFDRLSQLTPLDWSSSRLKIVVNVISSSVMDLIILLSLFSNSGDQRRLWSHLFQFPVDMVLAEIEPPG
jgi:hypothetical protein